MTINSGGPRTTEDDGLPQTVDDGGELSSSVEPASLQPNGEPAKEPDAGKKPDGARRAFDDPRLRIYEAARKTRQADPLENINDPAVAFGKTATTPPEDETTDDDNPDTSQQPSQAAQQDTGQEDTAGKRKLVVNGREVYLSEDEIVRIAQMNLAADERLEKAKEAAAQAVALRQEYDRLVREARQQQDSAPAQHQHQAPTSPVQSQAGEIDEQVLEKIERIQLGDRQEAAEAFQELVGMMQSKAREANQPALTERDAEYAAYKVLDEATATSEWDRFQSQHAELKADDNLRGIYTRYFDAEMIDDLRRVGATDEEIALIRNRADLVEAHRRLRFARYPGLRSPRQIIEAAGKRYDEWRTKVTGIRPANGATSRPGQPLADRQARKEALGPQPRRAGSTGIGQDNTQRPLTQEESRRRAVQLMREARGQLNLQ